MKNLIRAEETGLFLMAFALFLNTGYAWWIFFVLLFLPDLSMIGYLLSNRAGALVYNVVHFRALALAVYILGIIFNVQELTLAGIILFAHSSLDRAMNYGLKYSKGFKFTHLGEI